MHQKIQKSLFKVISCMEIIHYVQYQCAAEPVSLYGGVFYLYQLYSIWQTHCGVSSVDRHAVRASVDEDGADHVGRRQERGLWYRGRRAVLIAEGQSTYLPQLFQNTPLLLYIPHLETKSSKRDRTSSAMVYCYSSTKSAFTCWPPCQHANDVI